MTDIAIISLSLAVIVNTAHILVVGKQVSRLQERVASLTQYILKERRTSGTPRV